MQYEECLEKLFACHARGIKLGLQNIQAMSMCLSEPQKQLQAIHVAGTNGKGSVVTKIAAALQAQGYKVGLYTSPHVSSFRERIRINGECISEEDVTSLMNKIFSLQMPATFFEYTTMLAFAYFAKEKVDVCVLETGLGGRFDATTICVPVLTVITSISLDHTQVLGHTEEEIAYEKAGIMKQGVPLVIGPRVPKQVILEHAQLLDVPLYTVEKQSMNYEQENQDIARLALQVLAVSFHLDSSSIEQGLQALPPCRFERLDEEYLAKHFLEPVPRGVILDVAHNPDGVEKLLFRLQETFGSDPFCVVCGFSKDKDVSLCLKKLKQKAKALFFVQAASPRAMLVEKLMCQADAIEGDASLFCCRDVRNGMESAFAYAAEHRIRLVVCGTFFIMDECRQFLKFADVRDPFDLNERK